MVQRSLRPSALPQGFTRSRPYPPAAVLLSPHNEEANATRPNAKNALGSSGSPAKRDGKLSTMLHGEREQEPRSAVSTLHGGDSLRREVRAHKSVEIEAEKDGNDAQTNEKASFQGGSAGQSSNGEGLHMHATFTEEGTEEEEFEGDEEHGRAKDADGDGDDEAEDDEDEEEDEMAGERTEALRREHLDRLYPVDVGVESEKIISESNIFSLDARSSAPHLSLGKAQSRDSVVVSHRPLSLGQRKEK